MKTLIDPNYIFWFYIPTAIAIFIFIKSFLNLKRNKNWINWIITPVILVTLVFAEIMLYQIFFMGASPIYIPHFIIGLDLALLVIQYLMNRK